MEKSHSHLDLKELIALEGALTGKIKPGWGIRTWA